MAHGAGGVTIVATVIVVRSPVALAETARQAEDDGCKEKAGKCRPGEGIGAHAEFGVNACIFKNITSLNGPGT